MRPAYRLSADGGKTWSAERTYGVNPLHEMTYAIPIEYAPDKLVFIWGREANGNSSRITVTYVNP